MSMYAVRIHGRGGQGMVTAAELLAVAAFDEGGYAQAMPTFGSERTGAPVAAFCRIDARPIRTHEPIATPDAVIIADPTLLGQVDVLAGLTPGGLVLVNTAEPPSALAELLAALPPEARLRTVPATALAVRHVGRAVPGAPLLAAFAALTGRVGLPALLDAIAQRFSPRVAAPNQLAACEAYDLVSRVSTEVGVDA